MTDELHLKTWAFLIVVPQVKRGLNYKAMICIQMTSAAKTLGAMDNPKPYKSVFHGAQNIVWVLLMWSFEPSRGVVTNESTAGNNPWDRTPVVITMISAEERKVSSLNVCCSWDFFHEATDLLCSDEYQHPHYSVFAISNCGHYGTPNKTSMVIFWYQFFFLQSESEFLISENNF